jgi:hypothetical protein
MRLIAHPVFQGGVIAVLRVRLTHRAAFGIIEESGAGFLAFEVGHLLSSACQTWPGLRYSVCQQKAGCASLQP